MSEISLYLVIAILLGYIFGWLITKAMTKERFKKQSSELNSQELKHLTEELIESKSSNSSLLSENNKILLENREQKLKLHKLSKRLKERDLLLKTKNNTIDELNIIISQERSDLQQNLKEHESEIEAFIEERTKILENFRPV